MRRLANVRLIFDVLAIALVAFVAYRLLVAPRSLPESAAYPAPAVHFQTLSGASFALEKQRGHVVFLEFYASWCTPCRVSLPLVESFARSHPQVRVVPVDVGEPRELAAAFARQYSLTGVAIDPRALSRGFFQLEGFPTMVVIDARGRIRATWQGLNPAIQLNMAHAAKTLALL
ncbi:MAG TPA: TlpA disulfide reductase family protein [Candidatus Rubrimentiphilum sp.]|nr:TlpA disulfide reductase family protein [Candidatus Rubrimentiphilum sp.]